MKAKPSKFLESHRVRDGVLASDAGYGNNGAFDVPFDKVTMCVVASSEAGWDHVSVRTEERNATICGHCSVHVKTPIWDEMDYIRKLFFRGDEWVIQYHAPTDKHVNNHPHVLHLWRSQDEDMPVPPWWMV